MIIDFIIEAVALPTLVLFAAVVAAIWRPQVRTRAIVAIALVLLHFASVIILGGRPAGRRFWPIEPWGVCYLLTLAGAFAALVSVGLGICGKRKEENEPRPES